MASNLLLPITRNNPNPIQFKKEPVQHESDNEIEIIKVITDSNYNSRQIPFRVKSESDYNRNQNEHVPILGSYLVGI
jgi:hypothetical protein